MDWTTTAILSAAISGIVNIIDSHLISRRMPGFRAFLLMVGVLHLAFALPLFYLFPLPEGISIRTLLLAVVSGILTTAAIAIMFYSFKIEEVSRVIPVVHTYPIFVAIAAVPLLGESLYYRDWLAITTVVAGAVIISFRRSSSVSTSLLVRSFLLLFTTSLLFAMANIARKYVLASISFWSLFYITAFCMSGVFLIISARRHVLKQLVSMKQGSSTLALLILNELLAMAAIILSLWAIEEGPVSLVSTVLSSRPVFVLIFALILSRLLPTFLEWQTGKGMLALRLIATAMIVSGIAIIDLT